MIVRNKVDDRTQHSVSSSALLRTIVRNKADEETESAKNKPYKENPFLKQGKPNLVVYINKCGLFGIDGEGRGEIATRLHE